ncbi:hypothetical protein NC653_025060 [Populus alba x Populus x berolinensis]|uniref:Uncharacterized protein n=1 Tax=Populus alba x Populus x berolinensis TaxID=444605 RepID=A0AAD6MB90_9ROSI|nr:hypothetical protein NC653_025060 [Populus alba x Populus x berolinensis]
MMLDPVDLSFFSNEMRILLLTLLVKTPGELKQAGEFPKKDSSDHPLQQTREDLAEIENGRIWSTQLSPSQLMATLQTTPSPHSLRICSRCNKLCKRN